jgi:hypothetical protein
MTDLDDRIAAILEREAEHEAAKRKAAERDDPNIMGKVITTAFAKAQRAQRLDEVRNRVEIKTFEC